VRLSRNPNDVLPLRLDQIIFCIVFLVLNISRRGGQHFSFRHDDHALNHVLELANVPGPVPLAKNSHHVIRDLVDVLPHFRRMFMNEVVHQQWNILFPVSQWRQFYREYIQSVKQVLSKLLIEYILAQIAVGSRDNPHIDSQSPNSPSRSNSRS